MRMLALNLTTRARQVLLLLKASEGYAWFRDVYAWPHCFLADRVAFLADGAPRVANPHCSVLVYRHGPKIQMWPVFGAAPPGRSPRVYVFVCLSVTLEGGYHKVMTSHRGCAFFADLLVAASLPRWATCPATMHGAAQARGGAANEAHQLARVHLPGSLAPFFALWKCV